MQVHLFVFDALPEALDQEVVPPSALAVHAELDAVLLDHTDKGGASEMAPLVGVEDPGADVGPDRRFQGVQAEIGGQGVREASGQDPPRGPVQDDDQVEEAVGRIGR